jgi:murein DD-endopeptidase MepM/ murein hydrolase activator NlpD
LTWRELFDNITVILAHKEKEPKARKTPRRRVNVMVVPHGGGRNRTWFVHGFVLVLLLAASGVVLLLAVLMVSDYWKNIIKLSQLVAFERRDREESYKLEVMEKGIGELNHKVDEVSGQYETLVDAHRLEEIRTPEALLPEGETAAGESLDGVERRVGRLEKNLGRVRRRFEQDPGALAAVPSISPCKGWLYRDFGNTVSPFTGRVELHQGLDLAAPRGTPIVAAAAGVVTAAGLEEHYGLTVELDHGNGYVTRYAHNMRNAVRPGMRVKRGQIIAYVGSTGRSSCTHVHFEVIKNGVPLNPRYFILRDPTSHRPKQVLDAKI